MWIIIAANHTDVECTAYAEENLTPLRCLHRDRAERFISSRAGERFVIDRLESERDY